MRTESLFPKGAFAWMHACVRAYVGLSFSHPSGFHILQERTFSLCFSETGGTMVIGGYDPRLNKPGSEMQYTTSDQEILAPRVKVTTPPRPFQGVAVC